MKDNYNPYPGDNPYEFGTNEFEEYEGYRRLFNNDRQFHVKRIEKAKKIRNVEVLKTIAFGALSGILAVGTVIHGIDLASTFFKFSVDDTIKNGITNFVVNFLHSDDGSILKDYLAILVNMYLLDFTIEKGVINLIHRIMHINKDIEASENMAESIGNEKRAKRNGL